MSLPYLHPYLGLSNGLNTLHAAGGPGGAVGGWVELGRTTAGSTVNNLTVSSISDKRYYMVLMNGIDNGSCLGARGQLNTDTGSNYSRRTSTNGAADTTNTSSTLLFSNESTSGDFFRVDYYANLSTKEKLMMGWSVDRQASGAGTAPRRVENTGKHAQTSNPISSIKYFEPNGASQYASGSELVVLGWDPADSHTNNFWEELASVNSAGAEDSFNTGTFTAKKYLWIQLYTKAESGTINPYLRVGNSTLDTGSNYAQRYSTNGASDATLTSQTWLALDGVTPASGETTFTNIFIVNNASNEKLLIIHSVESEASGAGNAPARIETTCKWANTSNQINIIGLQNNSGTGDFSSKSQIKVWGAD